MTYFDEPAAAGRGLADLLARDDIAAVAVAMPINLQPGVVRAALAAGKHVLSEKPVAETVATAKTLLASYHALQASATPCPIWAVAENYRYMKSLSLAEDKVRQIGGTLVSFRLESNKIVRPDGGYFNTPWRKTPTHPGGFLLDGGVHYVAALRALLAAADPTGPNGKITKVMGTMAQLLEILPPADTLRSVAFTAGGVSGMLSMSFGTEFGAPLEISVTTTEGIVAWQPKSVTVTTRGDDAFKPKVTTYDCAETNPEFPANQASGVRGEFAAFAESIAAGKNTVAPRQSPGEAMEDLTLLEAMMDTGAAGGQIKEIA